MISYSDSRVRGRVCTFLKSKYKTLESAEEAYHLTLSDCLAELTVAFLHFCISAFLHRMLGVVFTLKQFKAAWKQVVRLAHAYKQK